MRSYLFEFLIFGLKQARACVFAGSFFVLLLASNHVQVPGLARYDFIFLGAILLQLILFLVKIESGGEVAMIFLFHLLGLLLELYKTNPAIGSWSYPEAAFFKLGTVPLYSGFMYAAVGSYISQSWKVMRLRLTGYPPRAWSIMLSILIYGNFFTDHFLPDIRWFLIPLIFIVFWKTRVYFTVVAQERWMPLGVAFALIAFFIWIAENIATYLGAWKYPAQAIAWHAVGSEKITSWFLLVIISFFIVEFLKMVRARTKQPR